MSGGIRVTYQSVPAPAYQSRYTVKRSTTTSFNAANQQDCNSGIVPIRVGQPAQPPVVALTKKTEAPADVKTTVNTVAVATQPAAKRPAVDTLQPKPQQHVSVRTTTVTANVANHQDCNSGIVPIRVGQPAQPPVVTAAKNTEAPVDVKTTVNTVAVGKEPVQPVVAQTTEQVVQSEEAKVKADEKANAGAINIAEIKAYEAYEKGDYKETVSICTDILKENPKHINALRNRGLAYYSLDDYANAVKDFDKLLKLDPNAESIAALKKYSEGRLNAEAEAKVVAQIPAEQPVTSKVAKSDGCNSGITPIPVAKTDDCNSGITSIPVAKTDDCNSSIVSQQAAKSDDNGSGITPKPVAKTDDCNSGITPKPVAKKDDCNSGITPIPVAKTGDCNSGITPIPIMLTEPVYDVEPQYHSIRNLNVRVPSVQLRR
ncbi:tetratricopeptide repeat protein [bacterium]|nr:tetratricopeptide repeat protein [bacterium]